MAMLSTGSATAATGTVVATTAGGAKVGATVALTTAEFLGGVAIVSTAVVLAVTLPALFCIGQETEGLNNNLQLSGELEALGL